MHLSASPLLGQKHVQPAPAALRPSGGVAHAVAHRRASHRRRDARLPGVYHLQPPTSLQQLDQAAEAQAAEAVQHDFVAGHTLEPVRVTLERLYRMRVSHHADSGVDSSDSLGPVQVLQVQTEDKQKPRAKNAERTPDYFANMGDAIRTLREDIPELFNRELNCKCGSCSAVPPGPPGCGLTHAPRCTQLAADSIYRDDIVFRDPRNRFEGMKNYKLIFWSLRFHGRIFFSKLYVEVKRIWQPSDDVIKMRWTVHGVPRVPWEAEGVFDGISTYKLDHTGRVYEHIVDNVLLRDPPMLTNPPLLAGLNLSPTGLTPQQAPYPGASWPFCSLKIGLQGCRAVGGLQGIRTKWVSSLGCCVQHASTECVHVVTTGPAGAWGSSVGWRPSPTTAAAAAAPDQSPLTTTQQLWYLQQQQPQQLPTTRLASSSGDDSIKAAVDELMQPVEAMEEGHHPPASSARQQLRALTTPTSAPDTSAALSTGQCPASSADATQGHAAAATRAAEAANHGGVVLCTPPLAQFSWVRLYVALLASVSLLGGNTVRRLHALVSSRRPDLPDPSPTA